MASYVHETLANSHDLILDQFYEHTIVTGSVADKVVPKIKHSIIPRDSPSRPKSAQM